MSSSIQNLDHLKIPLEDILVATNHFSDENLIRQGGFGKIYKGKLLRSGELIDIVARRLHTKYGQGSKEFWTEILMLSKLEHENLVSLVGFCDEKKEKIVINKYEAKGSLDHHITDPTLTWPERINICVGIAHALYYIHYDVKHDFSVIHRNIKSSKILLDANWKPKLSGFELSMTTFKFSQRDRLCIEDPCGSAGYVDPTYVKTGTVTHKSDIYSFGVLLFEVLCGEKTITGKRDINLAKEAKSNYENGILKYTPYVESFKPYVESLKVFSQTAYDCLKEHREDRPSIDQVFRKLENAISIYGLEKKIIPVKQRLQHNNAKTRSKRVKQRLDNRKLHEYEVKIESIKAESPRLKYKFLRRRLPGKDFLDGYLQESQEETNNLQISLADIKLATQDFSHDNKIGEGGFGEVYRGKLLCAGGHKLIAAKRLGRTSDQGETELMTELVILSEYKHMNVIDLVSYCNEKGEKVIVYDYASRGSLDKWLKRTELTWRKRLEICIDIARGLDFLHGTSGEKQEVVIHRDIKSANILLHDDWKASIADFGLSSISPINRDINYVIDNAKGTPGYCDPLYLTTKMLTKESDIYSFGVLLFEMLCGRFVMEHNSSGVQTLVDLVKQHFEEGTLYEMVFEATKKQMAARSLIIFQNIAYQCIHEDRSKRPTTRDVLIQLKRALEIQEKREEKIEHLNISLDDLMLATQDFSLDNLIGKGGSAPLYKGQVTCAHGCKIIVAKRLDRMSDQRETERITELEVLLEYKHENIIALLGLCNEKQENIMVYEYALKGSLDRWLKYDGLTWRKRLEICIDIARGLTFLHGTSGAKQEVVIHRDIKSKNVLLDGDWKAKIAYFGCSLISPISQEMKYVVNNAKGTPGYCDPLYTTTGVLTKESDIYSFGVLLFEMLCGRSVMEHNGSRAHNLIHLVRDHFKEGTLYEIVFEAIKKQLLPNSLTAFQNIAYQCIHEERKKRPTAKDVLIQLKKALEIQDFSPGTNGVRADETISATEFQFKSYYRPNKWRTLSKSRFGEVVQISDSSSMNIQINVKTQLLSPGVNYGVYLVYKFCRPIDESTTRTHKLAIQMGSEDLFPEFTTRRDNDGWMRIELYQFLNLKEEANFEAFLKGFSEDPFKNVAIYVEGVEFRPISNMMTHEEIEELNKLIMADVELPQTDDGQLEVNSAEMTREEIEELQKASITNGGGSIDEDENGWPGYLGDIISLILIYPRLIGNIIGKVVLQTILCPCYIGWLIIINECLTIDIE